jgi:hypothetical protein
VGRLRLGLASAISQLTLVKISALENGFALSVSYLSLPIRGTFSTARVLNRATARATFAAGILVV